MPRSGRCRWSSGPGASGAIASTVSPCLPWRKLLPPAHRRRGAPAAVERLPLVERPRCRAAHPAGASRRGLSPSGDRWAGSSRRSARRRGSEDRGEDMRERQGRAGRRSGPGRQARLLGAGQPTRAERAGAGSSRPLEKPNRLLWRLWAGSGPSCPPSFRHLDPSQCIWRVRKRSRRSRRFDENSLVRSGCYIKDILLTHHPQLALALCMALARCGRRPRSGGGSWRRGRTFD